jgi:hypothetical protein
MKALGAAAIAAGGMIALVALFAKPNTRDNAVDEAVKPVGQTLHPTTKSVFGCLSETQFKELIVQMHNDSAHASFNIVKHVDNGDCHLFDTDVVVDTADLPPGTVRVHEYGDRRQYWTYTGWFVTKR